jgi:hypothetical protein
VQGLSDRDEIDGRIREARSFRRSNSIFDAGIWRGGGDLRRAGVGSDDPLEMGRQIARCLPAAGRAVPGEGAAGRLARQPRE